jgi:amino acid adenylation domain-containing protein/non-ribosomal peptide synthase protein (TIGR01720 family)
MSNISKRIAALSPAQKALLKRRLVQKGLTNLKTQYLNQELTIVPRQDKNSGVLAYAQERLWILHQLQPDLPSYNEINLFQLTGVLDLVALESSFNAVIQRHEVLRSKFVVIDGQPVCQIIPNLTITLPLIQVEQKSAAIELATEEAQKTFDLSQLPLFRIKLLQVSPQEYLLLIVVHHIICDGWSVGVFIQEVIALYAAFKEQKLPSLPELTIQYSDFACWERQRSKNNFLATQLDYWKKQLSGDLPILEIPTFSTQTATRDSSQGAIASLLLPLELTQKLHRIAQTENVTLFMLLLAAFKVLLYRYTNLEDILVGSPIANRSQQECEGLIGVFLNTLVFRSDLSGNPTFRELLQQVKKVSLEAYSNQDLPFEKLVQELQPERNISQSPFFQVMFILHNLPVPEFKLADLNVEKLKIDSGIALFDLTLEVREIDLGLELSLEYNRDRFSCNQIEQILTHYQIVLEDIVTNLDLHLSQINLLTEAETTQLLVEFNDNNQDYPLTETIDRLIEIQVAKTPSKIAVVDGQNKLTYQELNHSANQVARLLQNLGLQSGDLVGILQERNSNFAISVLAVLKAGGVYVPIDSSYPSDRIAYMLSHSESKILLTDSFCLESFATTLQNSSCLQHIICLDNLNETCRYELFESVKIYQQLDYDKLSVANLEVKTCGIDPAYTIYTSGSTGLPKGAIIKHEGAINHIYAQYDALKLTENLTGDTSSGVKRQRRALTFLQSAPTSSDISVWQFLAPLLIGGKTVIIDKEIVCQPEQLFKVIQQANITLVEFVPVVLRSLIDYLSNLSEEARLLPSLQWMMVTGESVSVDLVNQWLKLYPSIPIVNAYGPTEAADDITQDIIDKPLPSNQKTVSIGKPLANLNLYILDRDLQLLPVGIPGEICVSGCGVGLGYWRDEKKTKASFVPNPFVGVIRELPLLQILPHSLMYKTGDKGRWLPNGKIEFLGRIDHQVKIRGFRIELEEIEAVFNLHQDIKQSIVIVRENDSGNKQLVAYVISNQKSLQSHEIRNFLTEKLPSQMIPSTVIILESFPLTANGKIDRQALPIPDDTRPDLTSQLVTPQNWIEEILVQIWSEILSVKQIGIHDNFFELGGDSILVIKAISQANEHGFKLTPIDLFKHQTVFELARIVEASEQINPQLNVISWEDLLQDIQTVSQKKDRDFIHAYDSKYFHKYFQECVNKIQQSVHSDKLKQELNFWLDIQSKIVTLGLIEESQETNLTSSDNLISVELSVTETQTLLEESTITYRTTINEILLTALVLTLAEFTDNDKVLIDLKNYADSKTFADFDLSKIANRVTWSYPVLTELNSTELKEANLKETLKAIKTHLRTIPDRGIGYSLLRYLTETLPALSLSVPKVRFGYQDNDFVSNSVRNFYDLDIDAFIKGNCLQINCNYNETIYQRQTITQLINRFQENLRSLITQSQLVKTEDYLPDDFPLASLNREDLSFALEAIEFE